jgi:hypothetical protein
MKPKPFLLTALGAAAVFTAAATPRSLHGQAGADDPLFTPVIAEVAKQQAQIVENQNKIDEALAVIAEDMRVARIYAGRGGGKATGQ